MAHTIVWRDELDTGIDVIDQQHRRIVAMINRLAEGTPERLDEVFSELVDYTLSHFAFEEELMAAAGYPLSEAHKRVHEMFARRVARYQERHRAGEDVIGELREMLVVWLFNHIRNDDKAYAELVRQHLARLTREQEGGSWMNRTLRRLFG
ncbi:MAG: bacteriohemerythrin [Lysobacteraceae bacterium]|jgi:hemerythrin-like metal-binding domain|nr:bacteriohemerythrin [Xanthomonadaceae bacterium]